MSSRLANIHLQICCLVDMVLGTGKPGSPFSEKKEIFLNIVRAH